MKNKKVIVVFITVVLTVVVFLILSRIIVVDSMPSCCVCADVRKVTLWQKMVGDYPHYTCFVQ